MRALWMGVGAATSTLGMAFGLGPGVATAAAEKPRLSFSAPTTVASGGRVVVVVRLRGGGARTVQVQRLVSRKWTNVTKSRCAARGSCRIGLVAPATGQTLVLRLVARAGGRVVVKSPVRRVKVGGNSGTGAGPQAAGTGVAAAGGTAAPAGANAPSGSAAVLGGPGAASTPVGSPVPSTTAAPPAVEYTVPPTTREYRSGAVTAARPGAADDQVIVTLGADQPKPIVGGGAAIGPAPDLPYGMFARVVSVSQAATGGTEAVVETAAIEDVYDDVNYSFSGPVTPILVDQDNRPVPTNSRSGGLVFRGDANPSRRAPTGAFECKETSGLPRNQEDVWDTGLPFPIEVRFENTNVLHNFDEGSLLVGREPSWLLQFSGEAVVSVGFEAKSGFACKLSDAFRAKNRLQLPIRNLGPVPIDIFFEPSLSFSISAKGKVSFEQRHYFAYTLEKDAGHPLSYRRGSSADPVALKADAGLSADMFLGGDLSVMVGAAGKKSTKIGAGMYGGFGPEVSLSTSTAQPGCARATYRLKAELGVRLQLWSKRWSQELLTLSSTPKDFLGSPFCVATPPATSNPPSTEPTPDVIAAGGATTCARLVGGHVACLGEGSYGSLGDGPHEQGDEHSLIPVEVAGLTDATRIDGEHTFCAVRTGGGVRCWGLNNAGVVGDGTQENRFTPVDLPGVTKATTVSVGYEGACAARAGAEVMCWGRVFSGDGRPKLMPGTSGATDVAVGYDHMCFVRPDHHVGCFGRNIFGELGNGPDTRSAQESPTEVVDLIDAVTVTASGQFTCATRSTGKVACWGGNEYGALGNGTRENSPVPVEVLDIADAVDVQAGGESTCALRGDGQVKCWGGVNAYGILGSQAAYDRSQQAAPSFVAFDTPVVVDNLADATALAVGANSACARRAMGTLSCWGLNVKGSFGMQSLTPDRSPVPLAAVAPTDIGPR